MLVMSLYFTKKIKIDPKENFKDEDNAWLGL
jgi:hypothetical protein